MTLLQTQARDLFDVELTDEQAAQFDALEEILRDWNTRMNLTAIIQPDEVRVRHFLDSISLVKTPLPDGPASVIDVGTGAGFPGLPLAIAFPQLSVTLMDSTGKKITFMDHVISELGLNNAQTLRARAEDIGRDEAHREQYDVVVARALARMPGLLEYLLPLARVGGVAVAMKGDTVHEEVNDAYRAMKAFGGALDGVEEIVLPDPTEESGERVHYLAIYRKENRTPGEFPRAVGIPTRDPIV